MHISLDSALGRQRRLNSVGESVFQIAPNAAAGYSLRSLTGGDPAVVRVRRASDNSEKDFNSSGVSSGELVNWVNAQIVPPLDVRELVDGERTGALIPAAAAYSLRNLSTSYTDNVVEVRRSSDDAEDSFTAAEVADGTLTDWVNEIGVIRNRTGSARWTTVTPTATGFDAVTTIVGACGYDLYGSSGDSVTVTFDVLLNSGSFSVQLRNGFESGSSVSNSETISTSGSKSFTLTSSADFVALQFISASADVEVTNFSINTPWTNDGFVTQWYDQSGNYNHATQGTDASQPKIVDAGSLVSGGIEFDGVDDFFDITSGYTATNGAVFIVENLASTDTVQTFLGGASSGYLPLMQSGSTSIGAYIGATVTNDYLNGAVQSLSTRGDYFTAICNNTRQLFSAIGVTTSLSYTKLGKGGTSNWELEGTLAEVILYNSDQSANRTAFEANIGETYGIDLPSGVDTGYDEVDGFVETWYDQSGNGNDAVQLTAGNQPKIVDAGVLVAPRHLRHTSTVTLPDASQGTEAGKGFTITGLTYDASENCFWAINFGDDIEPVSGTLYPSVVKLSLNFSLISEIDLTPLVPSNKSAQGIAVDTSNNSLWIALAPATNDVINISKQGTLLNTVSLPDSSGLAYDPTDDTLWTIDDSSANLNHYSKTGTLLDSYSVPFSAADQLAYDAATDSIWCSNGGNGSIGNVSVFHKDTEQWDDRIPLSEDTKSIEGLAIVGNKLFVGNDGYFHSTASTNTIQTFNISNNAAIDFSASNVRLTVDTLSEELTGASTAITALRYPVTSTQMAFSGTSSSSRRTTFRVSGKYALFAGSSATTASGVGPPSEVPSLAFATFSGTGLGSLYGDGVLRIDQQSVGSNDQDGLTIGEDNDGSPTFTGQFYELLLYNSDQSTNRLGIEANINNQYDIY